MHSMEAGMHIPSSLTACMHAGTQLSPHNVTSIKYLLYHVRERDQSYV